MYAVTSVPLDSRTRAIFRRAEFGFFGVIVLTCRHTPRFCGHPCMAGCFGLERCGTRGLRINWLIVGMNRSRRPGDYPGRSHRLWAPFGGSRYSETPTGRRPVGGGGFFAVVADAGPLDSFHFAPPRKLHGDGFGCGSRQSVDVDSPPHPVDSHPYPVDFSVLSHASERVPAPHWA